MQGDDIINVAPKKANWDLRRGRGEEAGEAGAQGHSGALVAIMQEQQMQTLDREGGQAD